MEEQQKNIDDVFRQSLSDFRRTAPPSHAVWDRVASKLDERRTQSGWGMRTYWPWIAVLLLFVAAGTWIMVASKSGGQLPAATSISSEYPSSSPVAQGSPANSLQKESLQKQVSQRSRADESPGRILKDSSGKEPATISGKYRGDSLTGPPRSEQTQPNSLSKVKAVSGKTYPAADNQALKSQAGLPAEQQTGFEKKSIGAGGGRDQRNRKKRVANQRHKAPGAETAADIRANLQTQSATDATTLTSVNTPGKSIQKSVAGKPADTGSLIAATKAGRLAAKPTAGTLTQAVGGNRNRNIVGQPGRSAANNGKSETKRSMAISSATAAPDTNRPAVQPVNKKRAATSENRDKPAAVAKSNPRKSGSTITTRDTGILKLPPAPGKLAVAGLSAKERLKETHSTQPVSQSSTLAKLPASVNKKRNISTNANADSGGKTANANAPELRRQSNISGLSLALTAGYEGGLQAQTPQRISGGLTIFRRLHSTLSLGIQPAFRYGNASSRMLSASQAYQRTFYTIDSLITYAPGTRDSFFDYRITQTFDSIVAPGRSAGGTFWELELPLLLRYHVPRSSWNFSAGPSISFGGKINHSAAGNPQPYPTIRQDSVLQSFSSIPASTLISRFPQSSLPDYSSYNPSQVALVQPAAVRLGYMLGLGYDWQRLSVNATLHQQLSGHSDIPEALRQVYASPYLRVSLGYRLMQTRSARKSPGI